MIRCCSRAKSRVEDTAEQVVLARIRELRAGGLTLRAIANKLNDERIPAKGSVPYLFSF